MDSETDKVIGMICITRSDANLLVVSEKGYGKQSSIDDYRITKRGGKGIKTLNITDKTGKLVAIKEVGSEDELMIINRSGITIRIKLDELRVMGRATQGVRLIKLNEGDEISSVAKIERLAVDEIILDENGEIGLPPHDAESGTDETEISPEPESDN